MTLFRFSLVRCVFCSNHVFPLKHKMLHDIGKAKIERGISFPFRLSPLFRPTNALILSNGALNGDRILISCAVVNRHAGIRFALAL